jgi:L-malate glycosyltransferase
VLEAMALGTPMVATAAGGTAALLTTGVHGLLVPVGGLSELVAALDLAITDRPGALRRAAAARLRVEHELSFQARMEAVERIYDELMVRPARQVAA